MSLQLRFSNESARVSTACPAAEELFLSLIHAFFDIWFYVSCRRRTDLPEFVCLATVIHCLVAPSAAVLLLVSFPPSEKKKLEQILY